MAREPKSVREFIEAALEFSGWKCDHCSLPLKLMWFGEENDPTIQYIECPQCNTEYALLISFVANDQIPKG